MPNYTIENAEARVAEDPKAFQLPSRGDREGLVPGARARLSFKHSSGAEGIWMEVLSKKEDGSYSGKVSSYPTRTPGLKRGDALDFAPENIIEIKK